MLSAEKAFEPFSRSPCFNNIFGKMSCCITICFCTFVSCFWKFSCCCRNCCCNCCTAAPSIFVNSVNCSKFSLKQICKTTSNQTVDQQLNSFTFSFNEEGGGPKNYLSFFSFFPKHNCWFEVLQVLVIFLSVLKIFFFLQLVHLIR